MSTRNLRPINTACTSIVNVCVCVRACACVMIYSVNNCLLINTKYLTLLHLTQITRINNQSFMSVFIISKNQWPALVPHELMADNGQ